MADSVNTEDVNEVAVVEEVFEKDQKQALAAKNRGNAFFGQGDIPNALECYTEALLLCPDDDKENKAVYHSNKGACHFRQMEWDQTVTECTASLELRPDYAKPLWRRAQAYEKLDKPQEALADFKELVKHPGFEQVALARIPILEKLSAERLEQQKEEMLGKLKDLGNSFLGNFGMSLDNFNAVKDPKTGSYSINFKQ